MYFAVLPGYHDPGDHYEYHLNKEKSIKNFLNKFSEVERIKDEYTEFYYYELSIRNLRKLKIQSLTDDKIKIKLTKLEILLNDKTKINVYGNEKPMFGTSGTGSTGTSGTSGKSGSSGPKGFYKGDKYNRFAQKPRKNFDFHKMKCKNLRKV